MLNLIQFSKYNRKEAHDILAPDTRFTPQAGTWGLQGIVKILNRETDYAFFVTYGKSQGSHTFKEGIDEEGILSWQSQPRMGFRSPEIRNFINHDLHKVNIYLFLRTGDKDPYTFLGLLEYVSHEKDREFPVYFKWRIIDWDREKAMRALKNLVLDPVKPSYPIYSNSFIWLSENVIVKEMDKSTFLHRGTHIPLEVLKFWGKQLENDDHRSIIAYFHDEPYKMDLIRDGYGRTRLFWRADFADIIHNRFIDVYNAFFADNPVETPPEIRFQKIDDENYMIDLLDEAKNDIEQFPDYLAYPEGKRLDTTGVRFERDPRNRRLAIQYHGLTCFNCGFNFGAEYGDYGDGFIEIHHIHPLYTNKDEVNVDPYKDLIPLCSNCHRMIHRSKTNPLSLDELRQITEKKR